MYVLLICSLSPFFILRLFSTVVITEKGLPTKTVVPSHWVSLDKYIVYFPPKGTYISEWAVPEPGWKEYKFIEFILEAGTLETCNQMLQFQTEVESENHGLYFLLFI